MLSCHRPPLHKCSDTSCCCLTQLLLSHDKSLESGERQTYQHGNISGSRAFKVQQFTWIWIFSLQTEPHLLNFLKCRVALFFRLLFTLVCIFTSSVPAEDKWAQTGWYINVVLPAELLLPFSWNVTAIQGGLCGFTGKHVTSNVMSGLKLNNDSASSSKIWKSGVNPTLFEFFFSFCSQSCCQYSETLNSPQKSALLLRNDWGMSQFDHTHQWKHWAPAENQLTCFILLMATAFGKTI